MHIIMKLNNTNDNLLMVKSQDRRTRNCTLLSCSPESDPANLLLLPSDNKNWIDTSTMPTIRENWTLVGHPQKTVHGCTDNLKEESGACKESSAVSQNFKVINLYIITIEGNPIINETALMSILHGNIKRGST